MPRSRVKTKRKSSYAQKTPFRYSDIHQTICEAERSGHANTVRIYKEQHKARFAPNPKDFNSNRNLHQWRKNLINPPSLKAYNTRTDHGFY